MDKNVYVGFLYSNSSLYILVYSGSMQNIINKKGEIIMELENHKKQKDSSKESGASMSMESILTAKPMTKKEFALDSEKIFENTNEEEK